MRLKTVFLAILILHTLSATAHRPRHSKKWHVAIEFWTDVVCSAQNTKTIHLYGVLTDESFRLAQFFDSFLQSIGQECHAVVFLEMYVAPKDSNRKFIKNTDWSAIWRVVPIKKTPLPSSHGKRVRRKTKEIIANIWRINVILLSDHRSLEKILENRGSAEWDAGGYFIVLVVWEEEPSRAEGISMIRSMLNTLWLRRKIQNVLLSAPVSAENERLMYTYNPFAKINDTAWGRMEAINIQSESHIFHVLSTLTYHRTKDLGGYSLNVGLFEQYQTLSKLREKPPPGSIYEYSGGYNGSDGITLGTLAKQMNFRINVVEPTYGRKFGHQLENGSYVGSLGDVVYGRVDAVFVSYFIKTYGTTRNIEFTTHVEFDRVCVIVPKAQKIPKWQRMYHIFQPSIWICLILSQGLLCFMWYIVQISLWRRRNVDVQTTVYKRFLLYYDCPMKLVKSNAERILLAGFFMASLTLVGTFNGILYKCFARNMYYKDIDTLRDLDSSKLPIAFSSFSVSDLFGPPDDFESPIHIQNLRNRLQHGHNAVTIAAYYRNVSGLMRQNHFPLVKDELVDQDGSHLLHLVKECPGRYFLSYLLPRNSYLRERVNVLISRLNQGGLTTLWHRRAIQHLAFERRERKRSLFRQDNDFVPFQLTDVQISVYMLGLGLLLASVAFLGETGRLSKWKFKKIVDKLLRECVKP